MRDPSALDDHRFITVIISRVPSRMTELNPSDTRRSQMWNWTALERSGMKAIAVTQASIDLTWSSGELMLKSISAWGPDGHGGGKRFSTGRASGKGLLERDLRSRRGRGVRSRSRLASLRREEDRSLLRRSSRRRRRSEGDDDEDLARMVGERRALIA